MTGAAEKVATRFVENDRFEKVWTTANRAAHAAVVHALTGHGRGAVGVEEGTVTLDVLGNWMPVPLAAAGVLLAYRRDAPWRRPPWAPHRPA